MHTIEVSESPAVVEFHEALARAFGAVEHAQQTGRDGNKKRAGKDRPYSTLSDVDRACRAALTDEGFSFPQFPVTRWTEDGQMFISVHTLLCRGGVTLTEPSPFELPVLGQRQSNASGGGHGPPDAQAVGSALTYARRYSLGALMGICPEDDDGHAASSPPAEPEDKHWSAFQGVVNRLSAALKVPFDDAYSKVREHANIPKGEPTDAQLATLTAAAERLLAEASSIATSSRATATADRDRQHTPERDEWVASCRELLDMMKADYQTAEGEAPAEIDVSQMRDIVKQVSGIDHRKATEEEFKASTARIKTELERRKAP